MHGPVFSPLKCDIEKLGPKWSFLFMETMSQKQFDFKQVGMQNMTNESIFPV